MSFFIFIIIVIFAYLVLKTYHLVISEKDYDKQLTGVLITERFLDNFINGYLRVVPFIAVFALIFLVIKRWFGIFFLYGFFLFFLVSFIDIFLNIYYIRYCPRQERSIFISSKLLVFSIVFLSLYYFFYHKTYDKQEYFVFILSILFSEYLLYITLKNRYRELVYFTSSSFLSLISISISFIGFTYLYPKDVKVIVNIVFSYILISFLKYIFNSSIKVFTFKINSDVIFDIVFYPLSVLFFIVSSYSNLFIWLCIVFYYLLAHYIIKNFEKLKDYIGYFCIFLVIVFFLVGRMTFVFIVDMNFERFVMFCVLALIPLFHDFIRNDEYQKLIGFTNNKTFSDMSPNISRLISFIYAFITGIVFEIITNYVKIYFGYSDTFSYFSVIIPFLFYFLVEYYLEDMVCKIKQIFLNLIFNLSVLLFVFSSSIVMCSYAFGLSVSNIVSMFLIYLFLAVFFSKQYLNHLMGMIFVCLVYMLFIVYVRI